MQPLSAEWVQKAEGDFATAARELRARKAPNFDAACFHAQQCAEKYLKARLQEAGIPCTRTHSLTALLDLVLPLEPLWEALRVELASLSAFAVEYRYPGESADRELAKEAIQFCRDFRRHARVSLGLAKEAQ
jgi:HEPN domain-containing protein